MGQCHEIFQLRFFVVKLFLLILIAKPRNDVDFLRIFKELFDYLGTLPVSLTPAKEALPVLLTTVKISSSVSLTLPSDNFTVLEWLISVNNIAEKFLTGVSDRQRKPNRSKNSNVNDTAKLRLSNVNVCDSTYQISDYLILNLSDSEPI